MRLLVCGGRDFEDADFAFMVLDRVHAKRHITIVIEGGQRGGDRLARRWAISRKVPFATENAEWTRYGNAAGPIRNGVMLRKWQPEGVLALPGNKGTADMVAQAKAAGVPVWQPKYRTTIGSSHAGTDKPR